ncbi:dynein regulatory complex subunit 5-like [Temnothorax curvispinosus]|uniref:Dynein regulatory complex subunit 5-like n=1 Tax=Temnothorax curvispinosus TaxID=300111 RepID=A0A6J1PGY7_9HYME|nr:dynein regulatory complex subunit 5-like [Temnothorax curvispinosus]
MRIPHTIPQNVIAAYRCSPETSLLPQEQRRALRAEDASWDDGVIPDLKILALRTIVSAWKDNPVLEDLPTCTDRDVLLETLPTNLPFELTIPRIEDEFYWERSAKDREQTTRANAEDESTPEENVAHHIPMAVILPRFPYLTEIYLNFGMIYMNDGFEWRDFEFSLEDCLSLGEGIKASPKLKKFSLTRSNLDQPRVAAILQGMVSNNNIEELDLSHCKLMDTGVHAVGEFLSMHQKLRTLHLANNNIGPIGVAGIVHGLMKANTTALKDLDLRLNPIQNEGANHICALLVRNKTLETLNISGCELGPEDGIALAGVLSSGCVELEVFSLDVSNNNFGFTAEESFEAAVSSCPYIIHLDSRMCNFSKESECSITENAHRNKQNVKKREERDKAALSQSSNVYNSPSAKNL